jgi:AAA+ ATPase superfamily predicted ATPase
MVKFIGRIEELEKLSDLKKSFSAKGLAQLVVIKGRRRIGKSRLAEEFAQGKTFISFSGIFPVDNTTKQDQLDIFADQFCRNFQLSPLTFRDWTHALSHLADHLGDEEVVILFDEISWMGSKDSNFVSKLKVWWDLHIHKRANVMVIFCGSISTWIDQNIINSSSFFGRIALTIDLPPLSLPECAQFLRTIGFKGSSYDVYKILAVTGGIPWYLEQIYAHEMADENIKRLCFSKGALLTHEFDRIFSDLFSYRGEIYKKLIIHLADGMKHLNQLRQEVEYSASGTFSSIMNNLIAAGFVTKHFQWSLKTGGLSKYSLYRLSDPYLRFYIKYIEPNIRKIDQGSFKNISINQLPGWESLLGYQVESLLLYNRSFMLKAIGIEPADVVGDNPYVQLKNTRQRGCQIDYLIQTRSNNLYLCEFKFNRRELGTSVIESVQEKVKRFSIPKGFGIAPVLLHLSGVTNQVYDRHYFYKIIDVSDFLELH